MRQLWFVGDADELLDEEQGAWLGATTETETNLCSHKNQTNEKSCFKLCWLTKGYYRKKYK